jgi:uncharacterized protein YecA (UPF0149 family)
VKKIDRQIVKNASNPEYWRMAKSLTVAAKEAGFDITNKEEMKEFIDLYNREPHAKPKRNNKTITKPKVGRNDPCPCGSGKKYKKCCGR